MLSSKVTREMASYHSDTPYFIKDDPIVSRYEVLRKVWFGSIPIKQACLEHNISHSSYYEIEERFVQYGLAGLFSIPGGGVKQEPSLEQLVLIVKKCRPSVSQIAVLRIAQAVPVTQVVADSGVISRILSSHGYGHSSLETDRDFWGRIQRSLVELEGLKERPLGKRKRDPT